jgi:hypothetical protein
MNVQRITLSHVIAAIAFFLALSLRLYQLGSSPLTDSEAYWANQALEISEGNLNIQLGPQPGYITLTALLFSTFGASNFTARFIPALAGSILVLTPFFFVSRFNKSKQLHLAIIIMAFGLALDPGLVTVSRQAGGPMMALGFGLFSLAAVIMNWSILAGIMGGLALLSGPSVLIGGVGLAVSWGVLAVSRREHSSSSQESNHAELEPTVEEKANSKQWRMILLISALTVVLVSTMFFRLPQGFAAWLQTVPAFLALWQTPSGILVGSVMAGLLFYELLPLAFALVGIGHSIIDRFRMGFQLPSWLIFVIYWVSFSLLLVILMPARQVYDLIWAVVPLWMLASWELSRLLPTPLIHPLSLALAVIVLVLLSLFWYTPANLSFVIPDNPLGNLRFLVQFAILALIGMIIALVALGWSVKHAQDGLVLGTLTAFLIYSISFLWGSAYNRPNYPSELWGLSPGPGQAILLMSTLDDLSWWNAGQAGSLDVTSTVDSESLKWELRNYRQSHFVNGLAPDEMPSIVITYENQESPSLAASYSGQDFVWWTIPAWNSSLPPAWIRWWNYREAPVINQKVILWVRSDLLLSNPLDVESGESTNP